jgi:O-antigen ligase
MTVLLCLVFYIPLQTKIDQRMTALTGFNLPSGLAFVNVLLLLGLLCWLTAKSHSLGTEKRVRHLTLGLIGVGLFSALAVLNAQFGSRGGRFLVDLIEWKRWASMIFLYFFTRKFLANRSQSRLLLYVMSAVVGFAGLNLLRENFFDALSASHFKYSLRYGGIFGEGGVNDLGAFFAEFVFIPLALLNVEKSKVKKLGLLVVIVLTTTACLFTYSRGAWLGLAAGLLVFLFRRSVVWPAILLTLLLIGGSSLLPRSIIDRWEMTKDSSGALEESAQMRVDVWSEGIRLVKENPVLGVGFNRFRASVSLARFEYIQLEPHNAYLKIAAEQGIPALLWFAGFLVLALRTTLGASDPFEREIARAYSASWVAFIVVNLFGNRIVREGLICYFWVFTGVIAWLRTQRVRQSNASK